MLTACLLGVDRTSDRLCLNEKMDVEALGILVRSGLGKRFPERCRQWRQNSDVVRKTFEFSARAENMNILARLRNDQPALRSSLVEAIVENVLRLYP